MNRDCLLRPRMAQLSVNSKRENELQRMLLDERARTEQHKQNYRTLKADHERLQEENGSLVDQVSRLTNETKQYEEFDKKAFIQTERDLAHTRALVADLKNQVLTPQKVELMKAKHEEEFEQQFAEILRHTESEGENYRQEYNKIRYEYGFLRAEYEHERLEFDRRLEETKLKYENEIFHLKKDNDALSLRRGNNQSDNSNATKILQKENLLLNQQIQELTQEIKETRDQLNESENKTSEIQRKHIKQITDFTARQKSNETEISSLTDQCTKWKQNLGTLTEKYDKLQGKSLEDNLELKRLQIHLEDADRRIRLESASHKAELAEEQTNFKKDIIFLEQKLKVLQLELEKVNQLNEKHSTMLIDKEKETAKRLQAIRLDESQKADKMEADRFELEMKYQSAQQHLAELEDQKKEEVANMGKLLQAAVASKSSLEKEVFVTRTKLEHYQKQIKTAEDVQEENNELRQQVAKLKANLLVTGEAEGHLISRNKELNVALDIARKEIESFGSRVNWQHSESDLNLKRQEVKWEQEKIELQKRTSKLERQIKKIKSETATKCNSQKQKINKYSQLIAKLRNRLELHTAKIEELNIEKDALKKSIPQGDPNTLKRQLRDLQNRHEEFRKLLQTHHLFAGEASVFPLNSLASVWMLAGEEKSQQQNFRVFQDRLKQLNEKQGCQMQELVELKMGKL